jgi:hypothetical protein
MIRFIPFLFIFIGFTVHAQTFHGKIGSYPIVMELDEMDWETGDLKGRYRYANKSSYLTLEGNVMQQVIWMEEKYDGEVTGMFYLSFEEDTIRGKWISDKKWYDVELYATTKDIKKMNTKTLQEFKKDVSSNLSGGYANENYYINDMWFREDNPQLEIGFSGGTLVMEELDADSLRFTVNTVSGPTYHIAYASGVAVKNEDGLFECLIEAYEGDSCIVYIEPKQKAAHVWARGNFLCGFGARAYLDHTFIKITDRFEYEAEEVFIEEMKRSNE